MNKDLIIKTIKEKQLYYLTFGEMLTALEKFTKILPSKLKVDLQNLIDEGDLSSDENGYLFLTTGDSFQKGKLIGHRKGYGFVDVSEDDDKDIFIPMNAMNGAIDGDEVLVEVINRPENNNNPEGKVIKILKRGKRTLTGNVIKQKNDFVLVPDNDKFDEIVLKKGEITNYLPNDKIVAELIVDENKLSAKPKAKVVEVLGRAGAIKAEQLAIIRSYDLREEFSDEVINEANAVSKPVTEKDLKNREDLRDLVTVTVDGEDARDFDDAISVQVLDNGNYYVGVHIADVGHYVRVGSAIDKEAFKRGTSVYFPDMVLPMIPTILSNGICSLNPNEDRFALSVFAELDNECNVVNSHICESVIRSKARMTYNEVTKILEKDEEMCKKYAHLLENFEIFAKITEKLKEIRHERGEIRFDIPEPYIKIGENGEIISITKRENGLSHQIIETLMVLTNEIVAQTFFQKKVPFIYRVHEKPDTAKQENFLKFIEYQGLTFKTHAEEVAPADYQKLLESIDDEAKASIINKIILRTMMKARYSPTCLGHFGLASTFYCHFTSPIRRYPDLCIHRIIKNYLHNSLAKKEDLIEFVDRASEQSSMTEKIAEEAEREVDDYKKAVYMTQFIGQSFEGVISSVQDFGLFVELENTTEGMIRFDTLPVDNYNFDKARMLLKGTQHKYELGDKVEIVVVATNIKLKQVTFELKSEYDKHAQMSTLENRVDVKPAQKRFGKNFTQKRNSEDEYAQYYKVDDNKEDRNNFMNKRKFNKKNRNFNNKFKKRK